ncbi:sigma-70 family RNA polymerase sigma factor [Sporosarcina sp. BP05]
MPPTERELVQLLLMEGFTLTEYAVKFGITVPRVKKQREGVLVKLRSEFV